jgi:hypothetical protein
MDPKESQPPGPATVFSFGGVRTLWILGFRKADFDVR